MSGTDSVYVSHVSTQDFTFEHSGYNHALRFSFPCGEIHSADWAALAQLSRNVGDSIVRLCTDGVVELAVDAPPKDADWEECMQCLGHREVTRSNDVPSKLGTETFDQQLRGACADSPSSYIGWIPQDDGELVNLGAVPYEGRIHAEHADLLSAMEVTTLLSPWKSLVIAGVAEADAEVIIRFLAPRGFIFDANSAYL